MPDSQIPTNDSGYVLDTDPSVVDAVKRIWDLMDQHSGPKLGLDWRIVIERNGRPTAVVERTLNEGMKMHFYGDAKR